MTDTFDYVAAQATADRLITKFGTASAIRRTVNSGSADEPTRTPTDYATQAVRLNLPRWLPAFLDNSDVLRTDRLAYVAMGPLALLGIANVTAFDSFVFDTAGENVVYRIIDAKPIAPAGFAATYCLQLRI